MTNKLFGQTLSEGIRSVKARTGNSIRFIEAELAKELEYSVDNVQRWRRGHVPKENYQIAFLAKYIVQNGKLGRKWLNRFLSQAQYYEHQKLLDQLCPSQAYTAMDSNVIMQNLPPRSGEFIGRQQEKKEVIEGLTSRWPLIAVEGMGGVGKTTLAIEVANSCLPGKNSTLDDPFDACVFLSAKERSITLNDLLDTVAHVLNYPYIVQQTPPDEKPAEVDKLLRVHRVLVIADNFETVHDPSLIDYLQRIPEPSKVIITTRYGQLRRVWDVPLKGLTNHEALELIRRHAHRLRLSAVSQAGDDILQPLIEVTGGNPYALETALGYLKYGQQSLDGLVNALFEAGQEVEDIFSYIFHHAWNILGHDARNLLMVMYLFRESASKMAIGAAAGVEGYYLETAVAQLGEMSLLEVSDILEEEKQRYRVHPLTLSFAGAMLREVPEWEQQARERWFAYYQEFANRYGGQDWDNWQSYEIAHLELANLLSVCHWAFDNRAAEDVLKFYDDVNNVLFIQGMWKENIRLSQHAVQVAEKAGSIRDKSRWLQDCGWVLIWCDQFDEAKKYLKEAKELAESINDVVRVRRVIHDLGVLHLRQKNYQKAVELLQHSMKVALEYGNDRDVVGDWYYLGCAAFKLGDMDKASEWFEQVKSHGHDIRWARSHAYARNWLADIKMIRGDIKLARQLLDEGFIIARNFKDQRRIAYFKRSFALLEEAEGNNGKALDYAQQAGDLFTRLGMQQEIAEMELFTQRLTMAN